MDFFIYLFFFFLIFKSRSYLPLPGFNLRWHTGIFSSESFRSSVDVSVLYAWCSVVSVFSWRYVVVTGFTKVSSLCVLALSVSLLVSVCLPSFSGVTPFWHYCHDSVPICLSLSGFPSISPSFPLPPRGLMFRGCDRSRVNLWISFYWLSLSLSCWGFFFPSERRWKWKSCTSQHSRGWTSCTCEHKTSGDAVTSRLLSPSVILRWYFSNIEKKKFEKLPRRRTWSWNGLSGGKNLRFLSLQMGRFAGIYPKMRRQQSLFSSLNAVRSRLFMPLVGSELKNNINKPRSNRSFSGHGSSRIFTWRPANVSSSNTPECPSLQLQPVIAESHLCLYLSLDSPEQDFNSHSERRVQTDM